MLINTRDEGEVHLIIGTRMITHRVNQIIQAGAKPIVISPNPITINLDDVEIIKKSYDAQDLFQNGERVDKVFVTLPIANKEIIETIYKDCKKFKIPINTTDLIEYSTFTMLNVLENGDLKIGVSTSGKGCKLSSKIKRHIAKNLPNNINEIIDNVSQIRDQLKNLDNVIYDKNDEDIPDNEINLLVKEFDMTEEDKQRKRSRWLNQIIEYYPLLKLSEITLNDLDNKPKSLSPSPSPSSMSNKKGTISLVGAGPGSAQLLTNQAITEILTADLILADKLVPQEVLDLVPKKTPVYIAKKFPGNAERAQQELLETANNAMLEGSKVVRLKQGDPYIFGRGGEEFKYFNDQGFKVTVVPGITSALSAPMIANIPVTHRDVADQVLICTGTGRKGSLPHIPEFVHSRTTIFLMALHRSNEFVEALEKNGWPMDLPACIVERANCPDQRITRCLLGKVYQTMESMGSRPPGLLVTGFACNILM